MKKKIFFLVSKMFSFGHTKQTSKNIADAIFKDILPAAVFFLMNFDVNEISRKSRIDSSSITFAGIDKNLRNLRKLIPITKVSVLHVLRNWTYTCSVSRNTNVYSKPVDFGMLTSNQFSRTPISVTRLFNNFRKNVNSSSHGFPCLKSY